MSAWGHTHKLRELEKLLPSNPRQSQLNQSPAHQRRRLLAAEQPENEKAAAWAATNQHSPLRHRSSLLWCDLICAFCTREPFTLSRGRWRFANNSLHCLYIARVDAKLCPRRVQSAAFCTELGLFAPASNPEPLCAASIVKICSTWFKLLCIWK